MFSALPLSSFQELSLFSLVLGRMGGIFAAIPLFGGRSVPTRVRSAAVLALALVLYPVVRQTLPPLPGDTLSLALLMLRETLIGITLGVVSQAIFVAIEFGGQLVSVQTGLSIATQFDPIMGDQFTALSALQNIIGMLLFMTLGVHHVFLKALVESYQVIPVGGWHMSGPLLQFLTGVTASIFVLGIKLAGPVMVALLATSVVLGIMARAFPQMNVFMVSMPLNIAIGLLLLAVSLLVFVHTLQGAFGGLPQQIKVLFKLLS
jgi:flagellar biosynthetic protein FliR